MTSTGEDPSRSPRRRRGRARSAIERISLRRATRRATMLAVASLLIAAAAVVLLVVSLLSDEGGSREQAPRLSEARLEDIVDGLRASVVDVIVRGPTGVSGGTGWVLDGREGHVVTNAHVALSGNRIAVRRERDKTRVASLVAVAPCDDLALLRVMRPSGLKAIPVGSQAAVRAGQTVVAIGFPQSLARDYRFTTTVGVVSVEKRQVFGLPNVIQTDAAINPGNSGGPLVDRSGRLIGVNTLRGLPLDLEGQAYAIGVDQVTKILHTLRTGKSLAWGGLGLDLEAPAPTYDADGVFVPHVHPGTPAARMNLNLPAVMTAVNGFSLLEPFGPEDDQKAEQYCKAVGRDTVEGTIRARLRHLRMDWDAGEAIGPPGRPRVYRIPLN